MFLKKRVEDGEKKKSVSLKKKREEIGDKKKHILKERRLQRRHCIEGADIEKKRRKINLSMVSDIYIKQLLLLNML
jgi:hypothetical protein